MLTKILVLFFIPLVSFASEICKVGEIKYVHNKNDIIQKMEFCVDTTDNGKFVFSKNCSGSACKALSDPSSKPIDLRKYKSSIGSPGFKVCRELGGQPQLYFYRFDSKEEWQDDSRCIFSEKEFVSNALLFNMWQPYIIQ